MKRQKQRIEYTKISTLAAHYYQGVIDLNSYMKLKIQNFSYVVGNFYRPPNSTVDVFIEKLSSIVNILICEYHNSIKFCTWSFFFQGDTLEQDQVCYSWTVHWSNTLFFWSNKFEPGRKTLFILYRVVVYIIFVKKIIDRRECFINLMDENRKI